MMPGTSDHCILDLCVLQREPHVRTLGFHRVELWDRIFERGEPEEEKLVCFVESVRGGMPMEEERVSSVGEQSGQPGHRDEDLHEG